MAPRTPKKPDDHNHNPKCADPPNFWVWFFTQLASREMTAAIIAMSMILIVVYKEITTSEPLSESFWLLVGIIINNYFKRSEVK